MAAGQQRLADGWRGGLAIDRLHHRHQLLGRPGVGGTEARTHIGPGVDKIFEVLGRGLLAATSVPEQAVGRDEIGIAGREDRAPRLPPVLAKLDLMRTLAEFGYASGTDGSFERWTGHKIVEGAAAAVALHRSMGRRICGTDEHATCRCVPMRLHDSEGSALRANR